LSADRANASRRELIVGGMDENKVVRVVGLSSAVLFDRENPFNPVNRRISIIVMNKKAEEAAQRDGGTVEIDADNVAPANTEGAAVLPAASAVVQTTAAVPGVVAPVIPPGGEGM
jgi:chemotaxis protein MotB